MDSAYAPLHPMMEIIDKPCADWTRQDLLKVIETRRLRRITFHYTGLDGKLKELKMPVLIVYGTGDTVYPNVPWTELAEGMPNVEVALFEGQEHGAASNTPEGEARILEFLRSHTPS